MWKRLWRTWTVDKPAAFGDWLWQVCVVEFAAWLSRLTLRQIIAFIPVVILIVAYAHRIPIPPELMLVGDILAYIDIFSMILVVSLFGRATTIIYVVGRAIDHLLNLVSYTRGRLRRPDSRHPRVNRASNPRRPTVSSKSDDDGPVLVHGIAWAQ
jgi:hypothetical protein